MPRKNPWESYRDTAVRTASPGQLVLMLFEGAIRFAEQSLEGFGQKDPVLRNQTIHNNLKRAQAIVRELNGSLNMQEGGEVSASLRRLYEYLDHRLQEGNVRKQREPIDEVIASLRVLRDGWAEMLHQPRGNPDADSVLQAA
jgi:flagellar protein FliS